MKLRYETLFSVKLSSDYYPAGVALNDVSIEPTEACKKLFSKYNIIHKKSFSGLILAYQCTEATNSIIPLKPIKQEERFTFKVTVTSADFWFYADVRDWKKEKIFLLKNPSFTTTGAIAVHNGPLQQPILFRPFEFKYGITLENVPGKLEIRDHTGALIKSMLVRAKAPTDPPVVIETYPIDLKGYPEHTYIIRHVKSAGFTDEKIFCSSDYAADAVAIVEITYKSGAWTGVAPHQNFTINTSARLIDWLYEVHIRQGTTLGITADKITIVHVPTPPEPVQSFSRTSFDNVKGIASFKSDAPILFRQAPMRLQLKKTTPSELLLDPLPLPVPVDFKKDNLGNIYTQIIVNM